MLSRVSVIVPHYGSPDATDRLLRALARQTLAGGIEVIVVDDGSPERYDTAEAVRVHHRPRNGGFGAAVNSGARLASHEHLLVLNSDLRIGEGFVEAMLTAVAAHPDSVVAPRVLDERGSPVFNGRYFPRTYHWFAEWLTPIARLRERAVWHRAVGHDLRSAATATTCVDWVLGCAFAIPRQRLLGVGGFDERYHMNSEEVDLQWTLAKHGVRAVLAGHICCHHAGGASSGSFAEQKRSVLRSRFRYAEKWGGRGWLWRVRASLAVATAINFAWRLGRWLTGRPGRPWHDTAAEIRAVLMAT